MTLKVDYDLFTKEEREDIINDVKKYIKHDTSFDLPKINNLQRPFIYERDKGNKPLSVVYPRQEGKTNRFDKFINDIKYNTDELNKEDEFYNHMSDPFYFSEDGFNPC
jgi:hypothetical protein